MNPGARTRAARIDDQIAGCGFEVSDFDDAIADESHGIRSRRRAGSIQDFRVDDHRGGRAIGAVALGEVDRRDGVGDAPGSASARLVTTITPKRSST